MSLLSTALYVVAVLCAVWVIYDVWTKQKRMKESYKIAWTIAAVILSILTAIVYYFMIKKD